MYSLYDDLIEGINPDITVKEIYQGDIWTMVETEKNTGVAMTVNIDTIDQKVEFEKNMKLKKLASYVKSWNLKTASVGMAAINAYYNDRGKFREESEDAFVKYKQMVKGKNVAVVGHFMFVEKMFGEAENLYILEKDPIKGDYPDSACEFLIPESDYVFITGATFVNKTIVRLLELARGKEVFMVGPTVPMSEKLFKYSVTNLSGFVVTEPENLKQTLRKNTCRGIFNDGIMVSMTK